MPEATDRRVNDLQELATLTPGCYVPVDSSAYGTRKYDLGNYIYNASGEGLRYDWDAGEYVLETVANLFRSKRDGLAYGVSVPKGSATACTKLGANAGVENPTPGTIGTPCRDPYHGQGPFFYLDNVNWYLDDDGGYHIKAIDGDGLFCDDGSFGEVGTLACVLWYLVNDRQDAVEHFVSDTRLSGMRAQPGAYYADGTLKPFMVYAKYAGCKGTDGYMHSYSGYKPWTRAVSHNSYITQCRTATTAYSGKNVADDWYVKEMFLLKYATKNSQSVFAGCTSYNYQFAPTVAETNVTRVVISKSNAANLLVGSSCMLGTHTGNTDRNTASNYDIFDGAKILRIEDYDANNSAVYFDVASSFSTETTYLLSTAPWHTGATDAVEGDGSPTNNLSGKEPYKIQGIEVSLGMYEVLGNVILDSDGSTGWEICINHDSRVESTGLTSDYVRTGKHLPANSEDSWKYSLYPDDADGLLFGTGEGASQSTGMCDGTYSNKLSTVGTREFLGFGNLNNAGIAGLWCVVAVGGLGNASWYFGGRLSANGRGRAAA